MHLAAPTRAFPQASSALASTSPCAWPRASRAWLAGSVSLIADAFNNLSDASSNIVSLLGFRLASRPADEGHPYGHGRYEYLAGLFVAVLVCAVGINLILESVTKIIKPSPTAYTFISLAALATSMLVKLWMAAFNRTLGNRIDSETLIATAQDSKNDVITSGSVLVAALISQTTGFDLDGWAGLGVGIFICISGMGLVRDAISPLLGQAPDPKLVQAIRDKIMSYPAGLGHTRPDGARLRPRSSVCQRPRGDARRGRRI